MKAEDKGWNFCKTPEEKCTMNYCDDNGCQNRERNLVDVKAEEIKTDFNDFTKKELIQFCKDSKSNNESQQKEINNLLKSHSEWMLLAVDRKKEIDKLTNLLKVIRSQLFDVNSCDTILTKSIDVLLNK